MPDLQQPTDVSEATPINRILAQAAAAAFANRRDEAHELLQQAIRQAPSSPEVWLACAALAGDPVERLAYLERACALNPTDTRARTLAGRARVQVINQLTEQGIAAVRDKNMGAARQHFAEIVRLDPTHEVTWLRLAALAESPEEQVALIKQVLRINPANDKARATLIEAEKQLAQTHLRHASAEIEAGQYANARAALRRSLQLDNTSEDAWSLMALIAEDAEERQNAADRLDALRAAQLVASAPPAEPEPEPVLTVVDVPADAPVVIDIADVAGRDRRRVARRIRFAATRSGRRRRPARRGCATAQGSAPSELALEFELAATEPVPSEPVAAVEPMVYVPLGDRHPTPAVEAPAAESRRGGDRGRRGPASARGARRRRAGVETVVAAAAVPRCARWSPTARSPTTPGSSPSGARRRSPRRQPPRRRSAAARRRRDAGGPAPARCCPTSPPRRLAPTGPARSARRCARRPSTSARPAAA